MVGLELDGGIGIPSEGRCVSPPSTGCTGTSCQLPAGEPSLGPPVMCRFHLRQMCLSVSALPSYLVSTCNFTPAVIYEVHKKTEEIHKTMTVHLYYFPLLSSLLIFQFCANITSLLIYAAYITFIQYVRAN